MYGQKALELVKELHRSDAIPAYNVRREGVRSWAATQPC